MRSEHNSILEVPTPDPLGVYVPAPDPIGVYVPAAGNGVPTPDPLGVYVPAPDPLGVKRYLRTACFKIVHTHVSHLEYSMSAPYRVPT